MGKKKAAGKKKDLEMIHFRPGLELGTLIGQFAHQTMLSRGEAAKRLTSLAIRGLYGEIEQLSTHLYGASSFDEASHAAYVALFEVASEAGIDVVDLPRDQKFAVVREIVNRYQLMRGFEDVAEKNKVQIKLYRSTE